MGMVWLAQLSELVRSQPFDHKDPSSIPGSANIGILVRPFPPLKLTQLSILPG